MFSPTGAMSRSVSGSRCSTSTTARSTMRQLDAIGVEPGWRCLEVGAGAGLMTRRLADRVAPTGKVIAMDLGSRCELRSPGRGARLDRSRPRRRPSHAPSPIRVHGRALDGRADEVRPIAGEEAGGSRVAPCRAYARTSRATQPTTPTCDRTPRAVVGDRHRRAR
jgi:hypothetical protein